MHSLPIHVQSVFNLSSNRIQYESIPCPNRVQSEFKPCPNRARGSFGSTPVHANVRYEAQADVSSVQGSPFLTPVHRSHRRIRILVCGALEALPLGMFHASSPLISLCTINYKIKSGKRYTCLHYLSFKSNDLRPLSFRTSFCHPEPLSVILSLFLSS